MADIETANVTPTGIWNMGDATVTVNDGAANKTSAAPNADAELANKKYVDDNSGAGDVTAAINLTDETIVQGDGGAKGVKTSTATVAQIAANVVHAADNTQAHSDYLLNSGADTSAGKITAAGFDAGSDTIVTSGVMTTGDHVTPATDQVINVCFGTGAAPAANTTTIGSLYITYTA